jgi:glyoxylase-like metal-dependent hydrolase (beta-lactamase superfamily II)
MWGKQSNLRSSRKTMPTIEVIPGVYQFMFAGVNVALIAEEELTLIDTGVPGSLTGILNLIRRLGRSVEEINTVIITHNHFDHIGGLPELRKLTDVKVFAHEAALVGPQAEEPYPDGIRRLLRVPFLSPIRRRFVLESGDSDVQLAGGEMLKPLGGLQVIHTPGHTPCSICLYSFEHKLLFVGDAMQRRRKKLQFPAKMVSTNLTQAVESVSKLSELDFEVLILGHGQPVTRGARTWVQALRHTEG